MPNIMAEIGDTPGMRLFHGFSQNISNVASVKMNSRRMISTSYLKIRNSLTLSHSGVIDRKT